MNNFNRTLLPVAVSMMCSLPALAADSDDSLTIYSSLQPGAIAPELYRPVAGRNTYGQVPGYAIVRHDRRYDIERGLNPLRVTDVAALIDPTTVTFTSKTEPRTLVAEQSFQFDLVSQAKLLQKYIGRRVTIDQPLGDHLQQVSGILLSATDGLTLQLDDGSVQAVRSFSNLRFEQLPGGLITKPTLEWLLDSPKAGPQDTRISYETQGMTWWADYNIIYDENGKGADACHMDLSAWVSIVNQSGASFEDARLKLIAGDVNRAKASRPQNTMVARMAMPEADAAGFTEKAFFEYHLYTLQQRTTLPDNSTKQIQLMPTARGIECQKELVFAPTMDMRYFGGQTFDQEYGRHGNADVNVYLRFANEEDQQLGVPLPAGRIRVNQLDPADGSLEFIGEDVIDHTPRNEEVLIRMGNAFDVVGERVQKDFRIDRASRQLWETFEITLRNHKDTAVDIVVLENLYRSANWTIEKASQEHVKETGNRIRFDVAIPAEGETVLRYTAHYTW